MIPVTLTKRVLQQRPAKTPALMGRVDADERQIPVRLFGMPLSHFLEGGQQVVQVLALCRLAENSFESFAIRMHTRTLPERGAAEVRGHIGRAVFEAAIRELASRHRHSGSQ